MKLKTVHCFKRALVLLLFLVSIPIQASIGSNNDFFIITQSDFINKKLLDKDLVLKRYLVVPKIEKRYSDILKINDEDLILAKFSSMLKNGDDYWMDKYIQNCDDSLDVNYLIKGLYYFSKKHYNRSLPYLNKVNNKKYRFLKFLLIADCAYEMLEDKKKYNPVLEAYQTAMDQSSTNDQKTLINNRIKYIRYH